MWRRVASQSPDSAGTAEMGYKMAYAAISDLLFGGHSLSGHERNSLFLNTGAEADGTPRRFANAGLATGFGLDDDTRALATVDWDADGDLDVWMTNRTAPRVRFLRNNLPVTDAWIGVKVTGETANRDGIGARLVLTLPSGRKLTATRRCGEGFVAQNSAWLHFGLAGEKEGPLSLAVHWPGGAVESFSNLARGARWHVVQGSGTAAKVDAPPAAKSLASTPAKGEAWQAESRTVLVTRLPLPAFPVESIQLDANPTLPKPTGTLLLFFASWCGPCGEELKALAEAAKDLRKAGLTVRALNVDELGDRNPPGFAATLPLLKKTAWPWAVDAISPATAGTLDIFHRSFLSLRRPLPLPASYLLDGQGRLAVIYRGPVSAKQVLADLPILPASPAEVRAQYLPFKGKWQAPPPAPDLTAPVIAWKREGCLADGRSYLESQLSAMQALPAAERLPSGRLALLCEHLADYCRFQKDEAAVAAAYERALAFAPDYVPAMAALGNFYGKKGDLVRAVPWLEKAHGMLPDDVQLLTDLGTARIMQKKREEGRTLFRRAVALAPNASTARLNLTRMALAEGDLPAAAAEMRLLWPLMPGQPVTVDLLRRILQKLPVDERAKLEKDLNLPEN